MVIVHTIWNISCVLLLILFNNKSNAVFGAVTLDQLKTVCVYGFPPGFTYDYMPPKEVCSAMGIYSFMEIPTGIELSKLKQDLPNVYVYYIQCTTYSTETVRSLDEARFKLHFLKNVIQEQNIDVLVLSLVERKMQEAAIPITVDRYIISVYQDLKALKKDLLIGLMLPNSLPNDLMIRLKDTLGELNSFYVIETFNDEICQYYEDESLMSPLGSADHLDKVMWFYNDLGFPSFQCFVTIDVFVTCWTNITHEETWTNSQMCESKFDFQKRYCKQTLADLQSQIETTRSRGRFPPLAGVVINWADHDDWKDTCNCGKFPALRVINSVIKNLPIDDNLIGCKTYAQHL